MTAEASKEARETCLNVGMDDYLTKPVETSEFYEIVERWATSKKNSVKIKGKCHDNDIFLCYHLI